MRINDTRIKETKVRSSSIIRIYISSTEKTLCNIESTRFMAPLPFNIFFYFRFFFFNIVYGMSWRIILVIDILDTLESFMIVKYAKKLSTDKS